MMLIAWRSASGQATKQYRLGYLAVTSEVRARAGLEAISAGLRERGYVQGKNLMVDARYPEGDSSRLPAFADELIALKPDILLGTQSAALILAAKTSTIPIVITVSADPVAAGLVKSLARPGANVTGMTNLLDQLVGKQVELLTEIVPKLSSIALLNAAPGPEAERFERYARSAAEAKGLRLTAVAAWDRQTVHEAFSQIGKLRAGGIVVATTAGLLFHRRDVIREASRLRLPAIYGFADFTEDGGLASYGANLQESYRTEVPVFVDQILKGAKPADLPVRQSTKYELVLNLKTARETGVAIPRSILGRADRVIE